MVNFLGDRWTNGIPLIHLADSEDRATMHLYGKDDPRPGRKMGHLTVVGISPVAAAQAALTLREAMTR